MACAARPALQALDTQLRPDDVLVVWRLDRLGRNLSDLLGFVTALEARGVQFVSLTEQMDTSTPMGQLVFQLCGALAEYERSLLRERVRAGLKAARARGGRKRVLEGPKLARAAAFMRAGQVPVTEIARIVGVSRQTLYQHLYPDGTRRQPDSS